MRALVTGAGGQLGRTVARVLAAEYDVVPLTRADLDVTATPAFARRWPTCVPA